MRGSISHIRRDVLLSILISILLSIVVDSEPILIHSDGLEWTNVTGSNEGFYDPFTNTYWLTYTKLIEPGNSHSEIQNLMNGDTFFKWTSNERLGKSRIRKAFFYKNGVRSEMCLDSRNEWKNQSDFGLNEKSNLRLEFSYGLKGKFWIAFPPHLSLNRRPEKPILNISSPRHLCKGESLSVSATSFDPENDDLMYFWHWGDNNTSQTEYVSSGTSKNGVHYWTKPGDYVVTVMAMDNKSQKSPVSNQLLVSIASCNPPSECKFKFISAHKKTFRGPVYFLLNMSSNIDNFKSINFSIRYPSGLNEKIMVSEAKGLFENINCKRIRDPYGFRIDCCAAEFSNLSFNGALPIEIDPEKNKKYFVYISDIEIFDIEKNRVNFDNSSLMIDCRDNECDLITGD